MYATVVSSDKSIIELYWHSSGAILLVQASIITTHHQSADVTLQWATVVECDIIMVNLKAMKTTTFKKTDT